LKFLWSLDVGVWSLRPWGLSAFDEKNQKALAVVGCDL